ncbi:MAG: hypothetical protein JOZ47_00085 [Kutzneria sp.]|nr:hypothetical protein [Kutzneria sp.]
MMTQAAQTEGIVLAWGDNAFGQLGDGTTEHRGTPAPVAGLTRVTTVVGGGGHAAALLTDGTVWCWGRNDFGQCGDGTNSHRTKPVRVSGLTNVVGLFGGGGHTLALLTDGTLWSWGHNLRGDLGDGTTEHRNTPVRVHGLEGVRAGGWGGGHGLALIEDGTVRAWGHNLFGALGDGTTTTRLTPITVQGVCDVAHLNGGGGHSIAITSDGGYWAWGRNDRGQLGDGTIESRLTPVRIDLFDSDTKIEAVSPGYFHTMALLADDSVWAWGNNDSGQLGDGTTDNRYRPHRLAGLRGVRTIASGGGRNEFGPGGHSLALLADGTLSAWGLNDAGQLGDGTTINRPRPVAVDGVEGAKSIVAAGGYNFALV